MYSTPPIKVPVRMEPIKRLGSFVNKCMLRKRYLSEQTLKTSDGKGYQEWVKDPPPDPNAHNTPRSKGEM